MNTTPETMLRANRSVAERALRTLNMIQHAACGQVGGDIAAEFLASLDNPIDRQTIEGMDINVE
ncbi:MAG: hypothetical protein WCW93_03850 [Candidatus Paceibacterota bacterium]